MKILVTGGAGFIGSALVRYLITKTECVVKNIDKLTYAGNLNSLDAVKDSENYSFDRIDITNKTALRSVIGDFQPDAIIHLAAESHVDRSIKGPGEFIKTNIVGTYTLLEAAREYWWSLPEERKARFRFHHVSTDEVYGDLPHPNDTRERPLPLFTEKTPYKPSSPYSASKASSDHLVRAWHRTYGLPVLVTNCSNNYGPYQFPEKLIPKTIINAMSGKNIPIYGSGDQIRDWLYVDDHVEALYTVLTCGNVGETYNIGGNNERTNLEVVTTICTILDQMVDEKPKGLSSFTDLIEHIEDRPGHDRRYAIDSSKVNSQLGWAPKESFESGLEKTVRWYLDNQDWWQSILSGEYMRINKELSCGKL